MVSVERGKEVEEGGGRNLAMSVALRSLPHGCVVGTLPFCRRGRVLWLPVGTDLCAEPRL